MATNPRAFGYLRVSTQGQAESGLGLEAQAEQIGRAADRLALPLADTFTDAGVSGAAKLEQRPALLAAIGEIKRGDVLLVAKRDRLGRDVMLVAMIERLVIRKGGRIVSAAGEGTEGDGPADVLMRQMLDAFAQFERALIGIRTKAALQARKRRGLVATKDAPYGFACGPEGRQVPCLTEQAVLAEMRRQRAAGRTLRAIAADLNARGFTTRTGGPWRHEYVARLVTALKVDVTSSAA